MLLLLPLFLTLPSAALAQRIQAHSPVASGSTLPPNTWFDTAAPTIRSEKILIPDSVRYGRSYWLEGGLLGATVMGLVGAATAVAISESHGVDDALLGFVPATMIGFPLGALIGAQFHKDSHNTAR